MTETAVGFIDEKTRDEYHKAKQEDPALFAFLERAVAALKANPLCGIKIPRNLWPQHYIKKYEIDNLWKVDLPSAWRLVYTIARDEIKIVAIILEWFDHKNYARRFGYG